ASQEAAAKPAEAAAEPEAEAAEPVVAEAAPQSEAIAEEKTEQEAGAPLSRVAKYLAAVGKEFKPAAAKKPEAASEPKAETAPEPEAEPAKRTGVSKYLAGQNKSVAESSGIASVAQVIKDLGKVEEPSETIEIAESAGDSDNVVRLDDGKQCQASTAKGTQCKNKSNLGHIQISVNDQDYRFSVCTQHNNENFKPFAELLES
ncbi:hypothetical protein, partial [Candidatus Methylomicrobium oryzae]|uniref:hypothetical protein n=1 Tax=Candidatus Methylomicrobium oryzae TaxID=2802053 RepID=UPI001923DD6D